MSWFSKKLDRFGQQHAKKEAEVPSSIKQPLARSVKHVSSNRSTTCSTVSQAKSYDSQLTLVNSGSDSSPSPLLPAKSSKPSNISGDLKITDAGSPDPAGLPCAAIWMTALKRAEQHPQWSKYCDIVRRENLSQSTITTAHNDHSVRGDSDIQSPSDPRSVASIAQAIRVLSTSDNGSLTGKLGKLCVQVSVGVKMANNAGQAISSANPYAGIAWGVIQFVAGAIVNNAEVRKLCWENLPQVDITISRCKILEDLYLSNFCIDLHKELIDEAMVSLFSSIINYQASVVIARYSKLWKFRTVFQDASNSPPKSFLEDISKAEENLRKLHQNVDSSATYQNFREIRTAIDELSNATTTRLDTISDGLLTVVEDIQEFKREEILDWLSSIRIDDMHRKASRIPRHKTSEWVFEDKDYKQWYESDSSSILWLRGFMGSGKSCLTHAIIDRLAQDVERFDDTRMVFFYCDGTDQKGSEQIMTTSGILRCFLQQLTAAYDADLLPDPIVEMYKKQRYRGALSEEQTVKLVIELVNLTSLTTIVIDGLDECPAEVQADLVDHLEVIVKQSTACSKLFIASRDHTQIWDMLREFLDHQIDITEHNRGPLEEMITQRVQEEASKRVNRRKYYLGNKDHVQNVIEKLKEKAEGMFRWVNMALTYLNQSNTFHELERRINKLSGMNQLFDLYDSIYEERMQQCDVRTQRAVRTALLFTMHGLMVPIGRGWYYRPISERQLGQACMFAETDQCEDGYSYEDILSWLPDFMVKSGTALRIPHFSVKEYLISRHPHLYAFEHAHTQLAALCMDIFNCGEVSGLQGKDTFMEYAAIHWITHLRILQLFEADVGEKSVTRSPLQRICDKSPSLKKSIGTFILDDLVSQPFRLWHEWLDFHQKMLENMTHYKPLVHLNPPSSYIARIYLDIGWNDSVPGIDHLTAMYNSTILPQSLNLIEVAILMSAVPVLEMFTERRISIDRLCGQNIYEYLLLVWRTEGRRQLQFRPHFDLFDTLVAVFQNKMQAASPDGDIMSLLFDMISLGNFYQSDVFLAMKSAYDDQFDIMFLDKYNRSLFEAAYDSDNEQACSDVFVEWLNHFDDPAVRGLALLSAAKCLSFEHICMCINYGADLTFMDTQGQTSLELAIQAFCADVELGLHVGRSAVALLANAYLEQAIDFKEIVTKSYSSPTGNVPYFHAIVDTCDTKVIHAWVMNGASPKMYSTSTQVAKSNVSAYDLAVELERFDVQQYFDLRSIDENEETTPKHGDQFDISQLESLLLQQVRDDSISERLSVTLPENLIEEIEATKMRCPSVSKVTPVDKMTYDHMLHTYERQRARAMVDERLLRYFRITLFDKPMAQMMETAVAIRNASATGTNPTSDNNTAMKALFRQTADSSSPSRPAFDPFTYKPQPRSPDDCQVPTLILRAPTPPPAESTAERSSSPVQRSNFHRRDVNEQEYVEDKRAATLRALIGAGETRGRRNEYKQRTRGRRPDPQSDESSTIQIVINDGES